MLLITCNDCIAVYGTVNIHIALQSQANSLLQIARNLQSTVSIIMVTA